MLSNVKSLRVFIKYWTSIIIVPFLLSKLNIQSAISFSLSEWAKTFEAKIKSAFFFIFFIFCLSKKPLSYKPERSFNRPTTFQKHFYWSKSEDDYIEVEPAKEDPLGLPRFKNKIEESIYWAKKKLKWASILF